MNKDINSQLFQSMYESVKPYFISILMITVSVVLIFIAIIPQFGSLLQTISQRNEAEVKLGIVKNNLTILKNTNDSVLTSQVGIALKALPSSKDFESVLNTISNSAASSGVSLSSYEFRVGDLSKLESASGQFPSLSVSVVLNDGAVGSSRFLTKLASSLPLSEVKSIDVNGSFSNITMLFYYKSLPSLKVNHDLPIKVLSAKQKQTLDQLTQWDDSNSFTAPAPKPAVSATNSAF